jgi:hypothetical protein
MSMAVGKTIELYLFDGVTIGAGAVELAQLDSLKVCKKGMLQQLLPSAGGM